MMTVIMQIYDEKVNTRVYLFHINSFQLLLDSIDNKTI
jgi:hypothetical protein